MLVDSNMCHLVIIRNLTHTFDETTGLTRLITVNSTCALIDHFNNNNKVLKNVFLQCMELSRLFTISYLTNEILL